MKSWIIKDTRKMELLTNNDEDTHLENQAKIKILRAGICSNDIANFNAKNAKSIVPSKLAVGLISNSADQTLKKGQRIMLSPYGENNARIIIKGQDSDGYLSDYVTVDTDYIYTMPDGISDNEITFIDEIALALKAYTKLDIEVSDYVILYGASYLNLIFAQLCLYYQSIPVIVDNESERLELAAKVGVDYIINTFEEDPAIIIKEITSGKMANVLVVDTDNFENFTEFLPCLAQNSKIALTSMCEIKDSYKCDLGQLISNNLSIIAVTDGEGEISTAINMLATGIVQVKDLIDRIVPFEDVPTVMTELSGKQYCLKTIVKC